jgi:hypothetical protein
MRKHLLVAFSILFLFFYSCNKVKNTVVAIKDKIINAYWSDVDNLTIKVDNDEAYVVDFGNSNLGSNSNVFNRTIPYIKNITRINSETWSGEIIIPSYDSKDKLIDFSYQNTKITLSTNSIGNEILIFSVADKNSKTWTKKPDNYVPITPVDPNINQPVTCDTISKLTYNNIVSLKDYWRGDRDFEDYQVRSRLFMPLNHTSQTNCHYQMVGVTNFYGNKIEIIISLSHKPTVSQVFNIDSYGFGSISPLDKNTAKISLEGIYTSISNGSVVEVTVNGTEITATLNNVILQTDKDLKNCIVNCVLKG